ncbi:IS110 family transposase [Spirillospora sp. CA-128828]|uniref:IS110 family transposase n=1 Tax=Spirillospora sp. CA-128828 TaxID=3240033 RepID=UPI003D8C6854
MLQQAWAGIDIGKGHHHAVVIDSEGNRLLSRRVANSEDELLNLIAQVLDLADEVTWAVDICTGGATLLLALLVAHRQQVLYISSTMVNRAAGGYRGAGKTDARDAIVIADQARMRRGLTALRVDEELIVELQMLVARRRDLVADRTRMVNRLREQLLALCPALERTLDVTNKGPLVLLTGYQRPADLRRLGPARLEEWLRARKVKGAQALAVTAVQAARSQSTTLPGEQMAALLVAQLAEGVMTLNEQIKTIEQLIEDRFHRHELAEVIESMPGIGVVLGAEFLAATGGSLDQFASADHLAGYAGLAPVPHDSGRVSGNLHRPRRYNRALNRVFYTSALVSIQHNPESRRFYDRKRSEGKRHTQAVLALARRRVNVLWALIRDRRSYQLTPPQVQAA